MIKPFLKKYIFFKIHWGFWQPSLKVRVKKINFELLQIYKKFGKVVIFHSDFICFILCQICCNFMLIFLAFCGSLMYLGWVRVDEELQV